MKILLHRSREEQKRIFEVLVIILTSCLLLALSRLETELFSLSETLSESREFITTLVYFALINLNVILILILSFLIFRNVTKLIVERKRGVLGAKLRTKLVIALVFFALSPTVLLFYVSTRFIMSSFETWFSEKIQITMEQTREAGSQVYKQDQKRLQSLARIALQRISLGYAHEEYFSDLYSIRPEGLHGFENEYGLNVVRVFDIRGTQLWDGLRGYGSQIPFKSDPYVDDSISYFLKESQAKARSIVVSSGHHDVVKGVAPIREPITQSLIGIVQTEVRFETQILKSVENILLDFANLKPGAQLIRMSYMILMIVITLLIVFSATWLGFYVARGISGPLQSLAEATREIALGNYKVSLNPKNDDETGQLVLAFNSMTKDLRKHQKRTEEAQAHLQKSNEELDQKRQYMEVVLKHITAGVIALDSDNYLTSLNSAAEKLLKIEAKNVIGLKVWEGLGQRLYDKFWLPVQGDLQKTGHFSGQVDLSVIGYNITLMINATRILDENDIRVGYVVVFDDASEQVKAQRVAAWREVARRIAHEIKNPITPIKLSAQRLLRRFHNKFDCEEDHEIFKSCIETIVTQVDALRDLVNEFSKFSRLPKSRPIVANISEILIDVVRLYEISYPDIYFDYREIENTPSFPIDKEQINRVFVNLFGNAIAALDDSRAGKIQVKVKYLDELNIVRVEIADNGVGIPKQLRERVLEPYFSTKDEGTGLGLAIVNQIITDHHGYLRLVANEPHGTTVVIEISTGSNAT